MEKLICAHDVSAMLGYSDPKNRSVRNLWKAGALEGAKVGRQIMFTERSVERYVREQFKKGVRTTPHD